uniref:Replication factor A C-terminal domain-containing protein n=1 Tax=Ananas comosus var. bracteatus TaxID=296719 RepID=A0A6V7Q9T6_ANACO|nr:unnamed protein product [Ananas comosus var. bracteatus]
MEFVLLKELTLAQQHCKIRTRISRMWESTTPLLKNNILSLDCLLIDEEGYTMQATVRKFDADHFRTLLSEGDVYIFENFNVVPSRNTYKVVDRKYMVQISKWTHGVKYTCKGKIVGIDTTYGWWYKACYDCKGAVKDYDDNFWCARCGKNNQAPIPWYKLNSIVEDETGSTEFTIFGKVAQDLIHVPAQQLAIASNSDRFVLPPVVKNIIGQTYIFQILPDKRRASTNLKSFRVAKIFPTDLKIKGKNKEFENNLQEIEEEIVENTRAVQEIDDIVEEISPTQLLQST